jgi:hypothetical protein
MEKRNNDIESGTPGASARARYERLRSHDDDRRRRTFGRLAPIVAFLAGPKRATEAWARGAEGEERIGTFLGGFVGDDGVVLHDRRVSRSRTNLDHLAIVASGVWVIDAKHYRGRLERRTLGGWFVSREALFVARRDQSKLVEAARRQRDRVATHLPPGVPVRVALCFTGVELGLFARPFVLDGVLVTWPTSLAKALVEPGPLDAATRHEVAVMLAADFPSYV